MTTIPPRRGPLSGFFSNPLVGLIGALASVAGLALAVYFYIASREYPELTFFVHPVKATVVKGGRASDLTVHFAGKPITGDITAAQIAVWNAGRESIREEAILEPVTLSLRPRRPILEASLRKQTRAVCGVRLDKTRLSNGRLTLTWRILERNDGAVIQLVYAGSPEQHIQLTGTIEGQPTINELRHGTKIRSPEEQYREESQVGISLGRVSLLFGLSALVIGSVLRVLRGRSADPRRSIFSFVWRMTTPLIIVGFLYVCIGAFFLAILRDVGPPFAF